MKRTTLPVIVLSILAVLMAACAAQPAATQAPTATAAQLATATQEPTAYPPADPSPDPLVETPVEPPSSDPYPAAEVIASGDMVRFDLVPDQSEARYLITEQLVGNDLPNDVVGATKQVSGVVYLTTDGGVDANRSKFVIQVASLATDQSRRDGYVRQNTLQAGQYPEIVFVPTSVSGLANPLTVSGPVSFTLTGNLTIRDVTKEVTWEVTGSVDGDIAKGTAKTALKFADFNLTQPRVPVVLSVEDNIRLEMDITLQRVAN
jgi:polyisoprenoid-binding protein YceI